MFHRLVEGMQKRSQNRALLARSDDDAAEPTCSGTLTKNPAPFGDENVHSPLPSTLNEAEDGRGAEDKDGSDDYGFFVGEDHDSLDSNDANTGDPFGRAPPVVSRPSYERKAYDSGDALTSSYTRGDATRSSVASFEDEDDPIFELDM
jgi:hypothetical protein